MYVCPNNCANNYNYNKYTDTITDIIVCFIGQFVLVLCMWHVNNND